jgi:hypothetical protein
MAKNWCKQIVLATTLLLRVLPADPQQMPNGAGAPDAIRMDDSWQLWLDVDADWQNDPLFLSDEVDLNRLHVNPPTGGWKVLSSNTGIAVTLPGTVEEHYWGQNPFLSPDYCLKRSSRPLALIRAFPGGFALSKPRFSNMANTLSFHFLGLDSARRSTLMESLSATTSWTRFRSPRTPPLL